MTMNADLQKKCYYGDIRWSFLVSLGEEKQIIPWTQEMNSNYYSSKSTELVHQEIAAAFGLPHNALLTITYIDKTGKEAVFPLCVIRLGGNVVNWFASVLLQISIHLGIQKKSLSFIIAVNWRFVLSVAKSGVSQSLAGPSEKSSHGLKTWRMGTQQAHGWTSHISWSLARLAFRRVFGWRW
jgi:hypothetical protein